MAVLGIESSAHTLGVGVVEGGRVLSNEKSMYHMGPGGIIPAKAADLHADNVGPLVSAALKRAHISVRDISAIGYTKGPGLGPCLRVGQLAAETIAAHSGIPIIPVNHAVAHIEVTRSMFGARDPLVLYVSGGNSQILAITDSPFRHYHVYGETLDIGVGNMLDNFARAADLDPAWGSSVERLARGGRYIQMPYTVKGMDFTFTGLMTNASRLLGGRPSRDVAYSLQETCFSMLCEATERALFLTRKSEILLSGGVAQNSRLRAMLESIAQSHGIRAHAAPNSLNADNGAMIAVVAEKYQEKGFRFPSKARGIDQRYRIDTVEIGW